MKTACSIIAAVGFAFVFSAAAGAATTDPEVIIYRFPGVYDNGGAQSQGTATVFHCTNFSGVTETMRWVTRNFSGNLGSNVTRNILHLQTLTMMTHGVNVYGGFSLGTGAINTGTTAIAASSINVVCSAMTIDAAALRPDGVVLPGIRFNPIPGSQE